MRIDRRRIRSAAVRAGGHTDLIAAGGAFARLVTPQAAGYQPW
jgi:hypothetical protein